MRLFDTELVVVVSKTSRGTRCNLGLETAALERGQGSKVLVHAKLMPPVRWLDSKHFKVIKCHLIEIKANQTSGGNSNSFETTLRHSVRFYLIKPRCLPFTTFFMSYHSPLPRNAATLSCVMESRLRTLSPLHISGNVHGAAYMLECVRNHSSQVWAQY
jgi:hypothetical protein